MVKGYKGVLFGFSSLSGEQLSLLRQELLVNFACQATLVRKSGLVSGFAPFYRELQGTYLVYTKGANLDEKALIKLVESFGGYAICVAQDGLLNSLESYMTYKAKIGESGSSLMIAKKLLMLSLTTVFMYKRNLSFYLSRK